MPFIGNQPALAYTSFAVQHFTTSATTSYTLDYPVANENEIRLVINNVVQQPGSSYAYTASGTSLTLSTATTGTDTMYAVFLGKAVQTVTPPANSITNTMLAPSIITGQTAETSIAGGDQILIYDDSATALRKMTRTNFVAGIGGVNTPAFLVGRNADQTISTATETKVQFNNESYDSDNNFDSTTNYRFTPTTAGKYFLTANIILDINESVNIVYMGIRKNSTNIAVNRRSHTYGTERQTLQVSVIADANGSTDYFEVIVYHARGSNVTLVNDTAWVFFHGFKLIT